MRTEPGLFLLHFVKMVPSIIIVITFKMFVCLNKTSAAGI